MKHSSTLAARFRKRVSGEALRLRKGVFQLVRTGDGGEQTVLFIVGCQRSGTNLMLRVFQRDLRTRTYEEFSELTSDDAAEGLRLNALDAVKASIRGERARLVVLKPLVESQDLLKLLGYFEGSKALWMYRSYRDVASSNLDLFGMQNGIHDLRPIVENAAGNWRAEHVPEHVREVVGEYFREDMNPYDAAALFWFVRNSFFFELQLDEQPNVRMCKYADLVTDPVRTVAGIYRFLGREFPGEQVTSIVHSASLGRGRGIELSPGVERVCQGLMEALDGVYERRFGGLGG